MKIDRRSFLPTVAGMLGLGFLKPAGAKENTKEQDIESPRQGQVRLVEVNEYQMQLEPVKFSWQVCGHC